MKNRKKTKRFFEKTVKDKEDSLILCRKEKLMFSYERSDMGGMNYGC